MPTPAPAVVVITNDDGGIITEFEQRYATFKAANERIIIDGDCISACTLVFNIPPRENVCVTERAKFGFHNAFQVIKGVGYVYSKAGTEMAWKAYPPTLRSLLKEKGWDGGELEGWRDGRLVWVSSVEAQQLGFRLCEAQDFDPWAEPAVPQRPSLWQAFKDFWFN